MAQIDGMISVEKQNSKKKCFSRINLIPLLGLLYAVVCRLVNKLRYGIIFYCEIYSLVLVLPFCAKTGLWCIHWFLKVSPPACVPVDVLYCNGFIEDKPIKDRQSFRPVFKI